MYLAEVLTHGLFGGLALSQFSEFGVEQLFRVIPVIRGDLFRRYNMTPL